MTRSRAYLLPRLAVSGIKKNMIIYAPYILTMSFMVCVLFIFDSISRNELMKNLPYADYVTMLMKIGEVLLEIIIAPFLFYTNNILMKRRKKELGLYSILGLEKKHIGMMMGIETIIIYLLSLCLGWIMALVFSKLSFVILLRVSGLPITVHYTVTITTFMVTILYFGILSGSNLLVNLLQVSMANPVELLYSSNKGEKAIKKLWVTTSLGIVFLTCGYTIALISKLEDGFIFFSFFFAVFLVVIGTYYMFTSGSISFLQSMRKKVKVYYRKENYITISGMLYRMKQNAASLVNICIFGTMIMITLICTMSLPLGQEAANRYNYPYDVGYEFLNKESTERDFLEEAKQIAKTNEVNITNSMDYVHRDFTALREENSFQFFDETADDGIKKDYTDNDYVVRMMTLEDYNRIEKTDVKLGKEEVMIFTTFIDYGFSTIIFNGEEYKVKKELQSLICEAKEKKNYPNHFYYVIMPDEKKIEEIVTAYGGSSEGIYTVKFNVNGEKANIEQFIDKLASFGTAILTHYSNDNIFDYANRAASMNGGLLFLGIFFSIVFTLCMVLGMYYKQIAEGLEDKQKFAIMKQVGISDIEIRKTINRQIKMVFFLPLIGAIIHTAVGLNMVINMLSALHIYDEKLIISCAGITTIIFAIFYGISYMLTAKTYYRIVR